MVDVWLKYGRTEACAKVPVESFLGVIEPREKPGVQDPVAEVKRALKEPVGAKGLDEIVRPGDKVALVVDDVTSRAPSYVMVPPILEELSRSGVRNEDVTIVFACGTHRAVAQDEAVKLLGDLVVSEVRTISHDCDANDLVYVGTTTRGTEVLLNKAFVEADVKILTGDIEPHYFAGYGGGRKSVLPGVSSRAAILRNHSLALYEGARAGILSGNPVHEDMLKAAKLANVDFIVNVVLNSRGEVVKAFAGDLEEAFYEGVKLVDEMYKVPVERKADVVLMSSGGHPFDVNLSQACEGIDNALKVVKDEGVIVCVAECSEGYGDEAFYKWMKKYKDVKEVEESLKRKFDIGGHKAYRLMKALEKAEIILVSSLPDYYVINVFRLKAARSVNDALQEAFNIVGEGSKVLAMPYGSVTLPVLKA